VTMDCSWARIPLGDGEWGQLCIPPGRDVLAREISLGHYQMLPAHFRVLLDSLPAGATIVDLGAHLGTFTLAAAANGFEVIAVEASAQNVSALHQSIAANGFTNVKVAPVAVSDHAGSVRFVEDGAWGRITTDSLGGPLVEVRALTLPAILEELGVTRVDAIKMDVEGAEPNVVAGMRTLARRPDAPMIVFENNPHTLRIAGSSANDLLHGFARAGYQLFLIEEPRTLRRVRAESFLPETVADYLALKDEGAVHSSWPIERERSEEDLVAAIMIEARSRTPDHRRSIAHQLADAPPSLLAHPKVVRALALLTLDRDQRVAHATRWWRDRRTLPTLAGLSAEIEAAAVDGAALAERAALERAFRAL
jgi:FkbM family methyltransferase